MRQMVDAAVDKAFGGKCRIAWMEIYAGDKSNAIYGENTCLPDGTLQTIEEPLVTPAVAGVIAEQGWGDHAEPLSVRPGHH
jgi:isocitrate dehydrogenase